MHALGFMLTTI